MGNCDFRFKGSRRRDMIGIFLLPILVAWSLHGLVLKLVTCTDRQETVALIAAVAFCSALTVRAVWVYRKGICVNLDDQIITFPVLMVLSRTLSFDEIESFVLYKREHYRSSSTSGSSQKVIEHRMLLYTTSGSAELRFNDKGTMAACAQLLEVSAGIRRLTRRMRGHQKRWTMWRR